MAAGRGSLADALEGLRREPLITRAMLRAEALAELAARASDPRATARRLVAGLRGADTLSALAIVGALALVDDPSAERVLTHTVRAAAPQLATPAALALSVRRAAPSATSWRLGPLPVPDSGVLVIQPFLHAQLDADGSVLGAGESGGVASLLRSLGAALPAQRGIDGVLTITRRRGAEPRHGVLAAGHRIHRITVGPNGPLAARDAWVWYAYIERELSAIASSLRGRRVVWHLRMGDAGSLAAAAVARKMGQPVVFTAVPDPHTELEALQGAGGLDRAGFRVADASHRYWLRARTVQQLGRTADRLVILPRPSIGRELTTLLGIDASDVAMRGVVVPEGVDLAELDRARQRYLSAASSPAAEAIRASLPASRRHLPWVLSVGRLHAAKGMHRLAGAVAQDASLAARVNLIIVGGDLKNPSADERETLAAIHAAAGDAERGVVTLTGHASPAWVADLLVEVATHGGLYACASAKEEFGLAIVEALAAGARVVAPQRGGPCTYVSQGIDGVLCDTTDVAALRAGIERGLVLPTQASPAHGARGMVRSELGVERMAERLARIYRDVGARRSWA